MPFDSTPIEAPAPALDQASLSGLAYLLRHGELWPQNFSWNFAHRRRRQQGACITGCAMGLADLRWGTDNTHRLIGKMCRDAASARDTDATFGCRGDGATQYDHRHASFVTPVMVAEALDSYAAKYGEIAL